MATYAKLTVDAQDIIGADFDKSRCSVWIEPNTDNGLIVVNNAVIRLGGRRETPGADGVAVFDNLVTTNSADNPTSFSYRVKIIYTPKGSRRQGHDELVTSDFPLTSDKNLANIPEAWDNVTIPPEWRSAFRSEMEYLRAGAESARAAAEALVISDLSTSDGQVRALLDADNSQAAAAATRAYSRARRLRGRIYDPRDFGAKVDGTVLSDVTMAAGSTTLDSAGYTFTNADIGKAVGVIGAGTVSGNYTTNANDGVLVSTITGVTAGNAVLANAAVNAVSGATAVFGTPDDDAIQAAQDGAAGGGTVFIPPGRMIVTRPLALKSYVEWAGAGRDVSWVEVIFSAPGATGAGVMEWLHTGTAGRELGLHFHDWAIEARCHIRPTGYNTSLKPLNVYGIDRCSIERMQLRNFPATAIPFDSPRDGVFIANNYVFNPGRLFDGSAGGSGIGIGVSKDGIPSSCLVFGNTIVGVGSSTTAPKGNNGIFIENQDGTGDPTVGFRIVGNFVQGMTHGIAENGAGQTVIANNVVLDCYEGITVSRTILEGAYAGQDTLISENVIRGWAPGASVSKGILVNVSRAAGTDYGNARVLNNTITKRTGRGIVLVGGTSNPTGIEIRGNRIRGITLSGIHASTTSVNFVDLSIVGNDLSEVGTADTASDDSGIRIVATVNNINLSGNRVSAPNGNGLALVGTFSQGGRVTDNDFGSTSITGGSIDTTVRVSNNTGLATLDADAILMVKPTEFVDVTGTSTAGNLNRYPYRSLPDAATTGLGVVVPIPSDWQTFTIQLVWTAASGSSGIATFRADVQMFDVGDPITATPTAGSAATFTAPTNASPLVNGVKSNVATNGKGFCAINLLRLGADAGDTLTNPALVLGVRLVRTA